MTLRIEVFVKTRSSVESLDCISQNKFIVRVNAPPVDNKANTRIIELLSSHFKVSKSKVTLVLGAKSKKKIFDIEI